MPWVACKSTAAPRWLVMASTGRALAGALLVSVIASGCFTMAPAIRTGHYGAPASLEAGRVEVVSEATWGPDLAGGPALGYGISDTVAVEGGAEFSQGARAIGWAGARFTPWRLGPQYTRHSHFRLALDIETGAGAGVGGFSCDERGQCDDAAQNLRRPAGGGYVGVGFGSQFPWYGLGHGSETKRFTSWVRLRTQASAAAGIPVTSLTTAMVGAEFSIDRFVRIFVASGAFLLATPELIEVGWFVIDGGLSFSLATPRSRRQGRQRP